MTLGGAINDVLLADGGPIALDAWRSVWTPPPVLTVSEWADEHRMLPREAASEPGRGATFRVLLPEAAGEPTDGAAPSSAPLREGSETILLVEDEDAVRAYIGRLLRELGYRVIESATPKAALAELDAAAARSDPVSLVVSDIIMPAGGGEAIGRGIEAWRAAHGGPAIPILYISGHSDDQVAHRMLDGRAAFIQKPFDAPLLARTVRALLDASVER